MIKTLAAAALLVAVAPAAFADSRGHAHGYSEGGSMRYGTKVVTVSCFRGPWRETIWDHPEPIFIDSLVNAGYNYTEAQAIATRICKDISLVGNDAAIVGATVGAINHQPPRSARN